MGILVVVACLAIVLNDAYVRHQAGACLYNDPADLPHNKVALVLGTAKYLSSGQENLYFTYRMQAAAMLYHQGKVEYLIVSGDNSVDHYNEPAEMEADLVARGVPAERIYKDYAGFRTLDSVVRAKAIFGQQQVTCVSQPFHNERAIYIGHHKGVSVVGFNAADVPTAYSTKVRLREYMARMKMQWDILVGKAPRFLGESVRIG